MKLVVHETSCTLPQAFGVPASILLLRIVSIMVPALFLAASNTPRRAACNAPLQNCTHSNLEGVFPSTSVNSIAAQPDAESSIDHIWSQSFKAATLLLALHPRFHWNFEQNGSGPFICYIELRTKPYPKENMLNSKQFLMTMTVVITGTLAGCASAPPRAADVTESIRTSLSQANLRDVSVSQDRDKGVVTLSGHVPVDSDKIQAESIAKSFSGTQVVANQIAVTPVGGEADAKKMNSALDEGISSNLEAALIKAKLRDGVKSSVKSQVVTLTGEVNSQARRSEAEKVAKAVPNVQQVVNELQVKGQKATSSK